MKGRAHLEGVVEPDDVAGGGVDDGRADAEAEDEADGEDGGAAAAGEPQLPEQPQVVGVVVVREVHHRVGLRVRADLWVAQGGNTYYATWM